MVILIQDERFSFGSFVWEQPRQYEKVKKKSIHNQKKAETPVLIDGPLVMRPAMVADYFGVTEKTVKEWGRKGLLVSVFPGDGSTYYTMESIQALALKKPHLIAKARKEHAGLTLEQELQKHDARDSNTMVRRSKVIAFFDLADEELLRWEEKGVLTPQRVDGADGIHYCFKDVKALIQDIMDEIRV
ncbi:hypothetical protein OVA24_06765 [Luteolibacter sp. SL250]|uniref:MerR family transcriptional regulator n=1 Tax=Luteolibacter sp. SL250 TaxID=2995170 RepID=UPI00226E8477|nr:MerR family transcriptional regulator [Luteolibacter sp. SL250]WAC21083.1 hypothetical protein OVA24_06765 [Luteolibacter sp. SL250]